VSVLDKFICLKSVISTLKINIYNGHPVAVKIFLHFLTLGVRLGQTNVKGMCKK